MSRNISGSSTRPAWGSRVPASGQHFLGQQTTLESVCALTELSFPGGRTCLPAICAQHWCLKDRAMAAISWSTEQQMSRPPRPPRTLHGCKPLAMYRRGKEGCFLPEPGLVAAHCGVYGAVRRLDIYGLPDTL